MIHFCRLLLLEETMSGSSMTYKGRVITGNQIGRKLGIPTINIPMDEVDKLPEYGVYVAKVLLPESGKSYEGVANLGVKPTIVNENGANPVCIEVNLFDFRGDLYDEEIEVELLHFVRKEMKFAGLDELKEQINRDIITAKKYLSKA